MPMTVMLMAMPGASEIHGALSTKARPLLIIRPQSGGGRLHTEAEETQHSTEQDGEHHAQACFHHQDWPDVGQQLAPQDIVQAFAAGAGGLDEFAAHQVERDAARDTANWGAGDRMPIAKAVLIRLGGVIAMMSRTSMIGGYAIMMSSIRMITSSVRPRR